MVTLRDFKDKDQERTLKAAANRRRLAILRYLRSHPHKEASVGNISQELKLSFAATSKHLRVLAAAKLVDREQKSYEGYYSLAPDMPEFAHKLLSLIS